MNYTLILLLKEEYKTTKHEYITGATAPGIIIILEDHAVAQVANYTSERVMC